LPTPKYEVNRSIFKTKTVTIIEEDKSVNIQREDINISRKRLPSITRIRSEKCLPAPMPMSTKLLPLGEPRAPNLPSMKRIESSKGLRIHKPIRSQKLLQLD
jgi:hypothetical protein